MNPSRIERLTQQILQYGLDGIALVPGPNMLYLSGIHAHLSERPIVLIYPADDEPAIIIPALEAMKARAAGIPEERVFAWNDDEGYTGAFQQACAHLELSDFLLGVEAFHMRVLELELLKRYAPGLQTSHAEPILSALRLQKEPSEIKAMEKAVAVAERALEKLIPQLKIGQTEKQIAAMLVQLLLTEGGESIAFGPIVSAGPNSASPHAVPTDRPIQAGDLLVIDWGVFVDEYPSDITRTLAIGEIDPELRRVYETVKQANEAGKAAVRPGISGAEVDAITRAVIEKAGYGDYFIHRTGHGLGLEVHEPPYIASTYPEALGVGNVFTIEPGIYLPGRGGVRIEDNLVVTSDGGRSLTTFPRDLITIKS